MSKKLKKKREQELAPNSGRFNLLLVAVFIVSLSVLMFEITLTRVFSVTLSYHFVFLVVSLTVLGLGLGAGFIHKIKSKIAGEEKIFKVLFFLSLFFSLSLISFLILFLRASTIGTLILFSFTALVPLFFAGMFLSLVFAGFPRQSPKIYFADLLGAAAGALMIIIVLQLWGGINSVLLLAVIASLSTLLLAFALKQKRLLGLAMVASLLFFSLFYLNLGI